MKKFLLHISFYIILILAYFLILGSFADGNTDDVYRHFATPKSNSIIMGDSRGSQALVSFVLDSNIQGKKFHNFSLNIGDSPYGNIYFNALKKKLDQKTKNGIFILTVSPWNLSAEGIINDENCPENKSPLNNSHFMNIHPNYEYLARNFKNSWYIIYRDRETKGHSNTYLHKNGWLEVTVDAHPDSIKKRMIEKVAYYKEFSRKQKLSDYRLHSFTETIKYLKKFGKVFIVRLPTSKPIYEIELKTTPHFNDIINKISSNEKIPYFNFAPKFNDYVYTDGNHMYKKSSRIISKQIADSINLFLKFNAKK